MLTPCCEREQIGQLAGVFNLEVYNLRRTLSRTLPRAVSSSSNLVFSAIRSSSDSLSLSTPFAAFCPIVGPDGTVGVCMSSIGNPMPSIETCNSSQKSCEVKNSWCRGELLTTRLARFSADVDDISPLKPQPNPVLYETTSHVFRSCLHSPCSAKPSSKPSDQASAAL